MLISGVPSLGSVKLEVNEKFAKSGISMFTLTREKPNKEPGVPVKKIAASMVYELPQHP